MTTHEVEGPTEITINAYPKSFVWLCDLAKSAVIVFATIGIVMFVMDISGVTIGTDDSDPKGGYSGFVVMTDAATGVQYLKAGKAITVRLNADGTIHKAAGK